MIEKGAARRAVRTADSAVAESKPPTPGGGLRVAADPVRHAARRRRHALGHPLDRRDVLGGEEAHGVKHVPRGARPVELGGRKRSGSEQGEARGKKQ